MERCVLSFLFSFSVTRDILGSISMNVNFLRSIRNDELLKMILTWVLTVLALIRGWFFFSSSTFSVHYWQRKGWMLLKLEIAACVIMNDKICTRTLIYVCRFQSSHVARRLAIRHCPICLSDRMLAVAEGGVGRPALHQISKLAQRDAQHSQETEIISADQLTGAEVSFCMRTRRQQWLNYRWSNFLTLIACANFYILLSSRTFCFNLLEYP